MVKRKPTTKRQVLSAAPCFIVEDVIATAEYYRNTLGFAFDNFFGNPPVFVIARRDGVALMFRQAAKARRPAANSNTKIVRDAIDAYLYVADTNALAAELTAKRAKILEGPVDRIYGMREINVRDRNGYVLCFGQDIEA